MTLQSVSITTISRLHLPIKYRQHTTLSETRQNLTKSLEENNEGEQALRVFTQQGNYLQLPGARAVEVSSIDIANEDTEDGDEEPRKDDGDQDHGA